MGLSIHYRGRIKKRASLHELIEEVADISRICKWKYYILETEFPKNNAGEKKYNEKLYGIFFTPEQCEPVCFTFLSNGLMNSLLHLEFPEMRKEYKMTWVSTKTQFAGMQTHIHVVDLIRYISKKYLAAFEMNDEGYYWETKSKAKLKKRFDEYNCLMDAFADALENVPKKKGEDIEKFITRLAKRIHLKKKK